MSDGPDFCKQTIKLQLTLIKLNCTYFKSPVLIQLTILSIIFNFISGQNITILFLFWKKNQKTNFEKANHKLKGTVF